jgi:hypothetical protein
MTTVWISPSGTSFSCLCEPCLETARRSGLLFADALLQASVSGDIPAGSDVASRRCGAGPEFVLRRIQRPPSLPHRDESQLALT